MRAAAFSIVLMLGCGMTDDRPAAWGYISPAIFQPSCATSSCHSREVAVAGVDFSSPDRGYTSLTDTWFVDAAGTTDDGCQPWGATMVCPGRPFVIAFDPGQSRLVSMLRGRGAPRMPPDRPLAEADIRLVESWILDGARKTVDGPPAPSARQDAGGPGDAGAEAGGGRDAGATDGGASAGDRFDDDGHGDAIDDHGGAS